MKSISAHSQTWGVRAFVALGVLSVLAQISGSGNLLSGFILFATLATSVVTAVALAVRKNKTDVTHRTTPTKKNNPSKIQRMLETRNLNKVAGYFHSFKIAHMKSTFTAFSAANPRIFKWVFVNICHAKRLSPRRSPLYGLLAFTLLTLWSGTSVLRAQSTIDYSTILSHPTFSTTNVNVVEADGKFHLIYQLSFESYYIQIDAATGSTLNGPLALGNLSLGQTGPTSDMKVSGNSVYFVATRSGDLLYVKIDIPTGNLLFSETVGGSGTEGAPLLDVADGKVYIMVSPDSGDFPGATGVYGGGTDWLYIRYDDMTNAREFATYIGGSATDIAQSIQYSGGDLIIGGISESTNFPVTNGSMNAGGYDIIYARINPANGAILMASSIGSSLTESTSIVKELNGEIFVFASTYGSFPSTTGPVLPAGNEIMAVAKLDRGTGDIIWSRHIETVFSNGRALDIQLHGGVLYLTGEAGATVIGRFHKVSASDGSLIFSKTLSIRPNARKMIKDGDRLIFSGSLPRISFSEVAFIKLSDASGQEVFKKVVVDNLARSFVSHAFLLGNSFYIFSRLQNPNPNYPTTDGTKKLGPITGAIGHTKFNLCPTGWVTGSGALTPATQMVCQNALVDEIQGEAIVIPSDVLPIVYINGVATSQPAVEAYYQWQEATSPGGPWVDIPGAVFQNFSPSPIVTTRYYQRLALTHPCCGSTLISTSQTAAVLVNGLMAPVVNAGEVYNTCPGVNVTLNASVTGGLAPYTLDWDQGAADGTLTPTVAPTVNTIYTLLVTDANGCRQVDQALVNTYTADAFPGILTEIRNCEGNPVRIGTNAIPGLPGVVYDWMPATGLSCTDCAQPFANPAVSTTYTFSLTVPISSGGTCQTSDMIMVTPVNAPNNNGGAFGGDDMTVCRGGTTVLGTPGEPGFFIHLGAGQLFGEQRSGATYFSTR